jgi:hypothetical protein
LALPGSIMLTRHLVEQRDGLRHWCGGGLAEAGQSRLIYHYAVAD